jgi:hypothetical protein
MHDWAFVSAGYSITAVVIVAYRIRIWRAGLAARRRSDELREWRSL